MSALTLDWTAAAEAGPALAGGKGWQLAMMARMGVPVPDGFVLSAQASRERAVDGGLSPSVRQALRQALEARGWLDLPLALRSSAPQEDSAGASFAGIHLSCLNVRGADAAFDAVLRIWDSAATPQARAYRERLGLAGDGAMAVVVMPLIEARVSGIAFTRDPVGGRHDEMLIHASWGLGEALVGGQAEGDEYRLREDAKTLSWRLIASSIGAKRQASRPLADGQGTGLRPTQDDEARAATLTPAQAEALGAIARDAARALDYSAQGHDLEWAWDGQRFWILQARPITASARHAYDGLRGQPSYWSRGNTREVLPHAVSALEWDALRVMCPRMLSRGFELAGYRPQPGVALARLFHGRVYLDASTIQWVAYDALGVAPALTNSMLGGPQPAIAAPPVGRARKWLHGWRILAYSSRAIPIRLAANAGLPRQAASARAWAEEALPEDSAALGRRLREQFTALLSADDLFFLQGSAGGTLSKLLELVEAACPGQSHALTAALMAGGASSVTAAQSYALMDLAALARDDAAALAWLRAPDRQGADWRDALPPDSPFRRAFADFLERYGHRAVYETYLRHPRWREAPEYLLDSVLNLIGADPAALRARQEAAAHAAWRTLNAALPRWKRPLTRLLIAGARLDCRQREAARSVLVGYVAAARRCALALGQRYAGPGGLAAPDDVFHLGVEELLALADGSLPAEAAARRAAWRRTQLEQWAGAEDPDVVEESDGGALAGPSTQRHAEAEIDPGADSWRGTPVAAGHARGPAFVARDPAAGLAMPAGGVLVAPSTDPAWTPLFLRASALVMQAGGYLSHGAIVAREFGIPALASVPGILDAVTDGDLLDVDAGAGRVSRVEATAKRDLA
ncbi:pyruvate, water dikinase [Achromobacter sp. Marseille-Q0513]|uniref:PEP/pyruvate-binding domain-containing protein n=1 Tax=Achromobacter sp. Marseille-Q0513 TaxID=2829161 RepID=UPI001B968D37|nr:PEP/pyruvate-binding domain-containing protein [Achromobacter sp. Marseille-Q0513]MBR8656505.1 pyruvate, water dikinase [Achromobacter sp. Marseille-Q0513]